MPSFHHRRPDRRSILAALAVAALTPAVARAQEDGFAHWLDGFRRDALAQGISRATLDRAFAGVAPIPHIIELDRRQPETTLTFDEYIARVVTPQRRAEARAHLAENRALLDAVGRRYGVQPRFIVALWGIETNFGTRTGGYPVIAALATLAYDGRRSAFFRGELMKALLIVEREHIDPQEMLGSWAGAMGQSQFMPSSFLRFAVSYRGGAAPDIWHRRDDVFASIANYLAQSGWRADETWGRRVALPAHFDSARAGLPQRHPVAEWGRLGVRRVDGKPLPASDIAASLILPDGVGGPALLVYNNFRTLLRWNNSNFFATAVGFLADSVQ